MYPLLTYRIARPLNYTSWNDNRRGKPRANATESGGVVSPNRISTLRSLTAISRRRRRSLGELIACNVRHLPLRGRRSRFSQACNYLNEPPPLKPIFVEEKEEEEEKFNCYELQYIYI